MSLERKGPSALGHDGVGFEGREDFDEGVLIAVGCEEAWLSTEQSMDLGKLLDVVQSAAGSACRKIHPRQESLYTITMEVMVVVEGHKRCPLRRRMRHPRNGADCRCASAELLQLASLPVEWRV